MTQTFKIHGMHLDPTKFFNNSVRTKDTFKVLSTVLMEMVKKNVVMIAFVLESVSVCICKTSTVCVCKVHTYFCFDLLQKVLHLCTNYFCTC